MAKYHMKSNQPTLSYSEKRALAYGRETDPLIGQVIRGEITQEEYISKVELIKLRYPKD
jgi:hypothetical protein